GAVTYAIELEPLGPVGSGGGPLAEGASASPSTSASASASTNVAVKPPLGIAPHKSSPFGRFSENNRYAVTVAVPGRPNNLYVEGDQGRGAYMTNALVAQEFEVDLRGPDGVPTSLRELERYDFVILSDTAASQVGYAQQDAIESYVRDLGGGFLMAGGQN